MVLKQNTINKIFEAQIISALNIELTLEKNIYFLKEPKNLFHNFL